MDTKKLLISVGLLLVLVAGYFLIWGNNDESNPDEVAHTASTYVNEEYNFSFERPEGYDILEVTDETTDRDSIVLSRTEDNNIPEGGEGPRAITVDIFPDVSEDSVEAWLNNNNFSNFNLLVGRPGERSVDGQSAVSYEWDGLYRGRSVALLHEGSIVLISGTYLEESDQIYSDFDQVVESVDLQ